MAQVLEDTGAGWVYSDGVGHARIDYRPGSLRDTFDFGPVVAISVPLALEAGVEPGLKWGALYDLRLRLSERRPVVRIPEPLYAASPAETRPSSEAQFDYVDPRNRGYQLDMERLATELPAGVSIEWSGQSYQERLSGAQAPLPNTMCSPTV